MTDTPAPATAGSSAGQLAANARKVWNGVRDPRFTRVQRWSFVISLVLVFIAVSRVPGVDWGDRLRHGWYHLFVVGWFAILTYKLRSVGAREIVRFWITGFFPVALVTYILTEPLEALIGTGNFQTGFWVPLVEELVKALPLLLWTTLLRPKHRHGTLSDFWILGLALGAGFSFHEDALYLRLVASGFQDGIIGTLFPIFLTGRQYVITHAGWTALAALGVGIFSLYRAKPWSWMVGLAFLTVPVLDHAAVNWRGGGAELMRNIAFDGRLGSVLLLGAAIGCIAHDYYILRWAGSRDRLFPSPPLSGDLDAVKSGSFVDRITTLVAIQRCRRFRNAAFCDLYRVRSQGKSAGDRSQVIGELESLARVGGVETNLSRTRA